MHLEEFGVHLLRIDPALGEQGPAALLVVCRAVPLGLERVGLGAQLLDDPLQRHLERLAG